MPDRLNEIRARLDARAYTVTGTNERAVPDGECGYRVEDDAARANQVFHKNAPSDIAYLLGRLDFETRLAADLEAELDRAHERHAAEIERLQSGSVSVRSQDTSLSVGKPLRTENGTELLPDDSVVQGVTKLECSHD